MQSTLLLIQMLILDLPEFNQIEMAITKRLVLELLSCSDWS